MIHKASESCLGIIEEAAKSAGVHGKVVSMSDFPADAIVAAPKKRRCDLVFMA